MATKRIEIPGPHNFKGFYHTRNTFIRILKNAYGMQQAYLIERSLWCSQWDISHLDVDAHVEARQFSLGAFSRGYDHMQTMIDAENTVAHNKADFERAKSDGMRVLKDLLRNERISPRDYSRITRLYYKGPEEK